MVRWSARMNSSLPGARSRPTRPGPPKLVRSRFEQAPASAAPKNRTPTRNAPSMPQGGPFRYVMIQINVSDIRQSHKSIRGETHALVECQPPDAVLPRSAPAWVQA